MKKSELKVGVEYAVLGSPGAVRSWNGRYRSSRDKPIKATVIDLDFKEMRATQSGGVSGYLSERMVFGIAVDTGSKVFVHGDERVRNKDGSFKKKPKSQRSYGDNFVTKSVQYEYDYRVLENAGCFISTWEDYLAGEQATKDAQAEREARDQAEREARTAAEADIKVRVNAVLDFFTEVGEVKLSRDEWRRRKDDEYDDFEVVGKKPVPDEDGDLDVVLFRGEFTYAEGEGPYDVLTGLRVGAGWRGGGLTLDAIEAIIATAALLALGKD